jgi:hypothetical protein
LPENKDSLISTIGSGSQVTAYGFSCWALSLSRGDSEDLAQKKNILLEVVKYLTIARDQGQTVAQVASGLASQLPQKEHWKVFSDNLKLALGYASGPESKAVLTGLIAGINQAVGAF